MQVEFLRNKGSIKAGEIITLDEDTALVHIANKIAIEVKPSVKSKQKPTNIEE